MPARFHDRSTADFPAPPSRPGIQHATDPCRFAMVAALACLVLAWSSSVLAADAVEEITIVGHRAGALRLGVGNGAGGRLGLNALQTPASVDLITGDEIAARGDHGTLEAITRSAGLAASANNGNGGLQVSSRGFNGHHTTVNTYDGTRLYITAGTVTFPADSWLLDRVEVLRGAGSVINGVGALATTINYVPKAPILGQRAFDALLATGSFRLRRVALGGAAPVGEDWALRLDGVHTTRDGYVDRADEERNAIAGSLLYQPSEQFRLRLSVDHARVQPGTYWGTPLVNGRAATALRRQNYNFGNPVIAYEDTWSRAQIEWQLSEQVQFTSHAYHVGADREWQNLEEYAAAANGRINRSAYLGIVHDQDQIGTRGAFLITSDIGGMQNRLSIGAELNAIELDYLNNFNTGGFDVSNDVPMFGFHPGSRPPAAFTQLDYSTDTRQYALFFDNVLALGESLSVVVGGRHDDFDFERINHAQVTGRGRSEFDAGFSEFTWRAGVVYQFSPTFSLYAQSSTAADPVTSPISINLANADFDLSEGRQYEVGIKQQLPRARAEYTVAWFDIEKDDLVTRLPGAAVSSQIGRQSASGLEVTFRISPLHNVGIDFNAAFVESEYDRFFVNGTSLAGNTPNSVPDSTFNLWVSWAALPRLELATGVRHVDEREANDTNTRQLPAYTLLDASTSWALAENLLVTLRARNLTNEKDFVLSEYVDEQWVFGEPRTFELGIRGTF